MEWLLKIWSALWGPIALFLSRSRKNKKKLIQEHKENSEKYDRDSQQKSLVLTILDQSYRNIPDLIYRLYSKDWRSLHEESMELINIIVNQIPMLLKKSKNINHRCAIFIPDKDNTSRLKIFEGCGYSKKGKKELRLDIKNSTAGIAYITENHQYTPDIRKDENFTPHPKSTKEYYSLLCVPIMVREKVVGVLSIDGSEVDCFSKDDIDFVKFFSSQIAIIMDLMEIRHIRREVLKDGQKEDQFTG